ATALCAMFGQGHQHFLGQLARLSDLANANTIRDDITATLFKPWRYEERKEALKFRWDPVEDRRYAYRYSNPSGQVVTTVPGANVLGALGFPLFVVAPRGEDLGTLAFGRRDRERFVTWPIWTGPLSLASIRALLTHPEIVSRTPKRSKLGPYGGVELMRSIRIQTDKYFNFGPALPLWGIQQASSLAKDIQLYASKGEAEGQR
ncbi:MAG: type I-G CRISPR-associated protein, Cas3-extension family, partial [Dehalococcoidia bacterium]